jgi:hypothetical protein
MSAGPDERAASSPGGDSSPAGERVAGPGWRRLWQPHRPAFWLLVAFNLLSTAFGWATRSLPLNDTAMLLFGALALLNALFGLFVGWRLWRGH